MLPDPIMASQLWICWQNHTLVKEGLSWSNACEGCMSRFIHDSNPQEWGSPGSQDCDMWGLVKIECPNLGWIADESNQQNLRSLGLECFRQPYLPSYSSSSICTTPLRLKKKNKQTVNACLHHGQRLLANFGEAQLVQQNQPGSTGISTNLIWTEWNMVDFPREMEYKWNLTDMIIYI